MADRNVDLAELEMAFAKDPASDAFLALSAAYLEQGRFMEAMVVCKKGIKSQPDNIEGRLLLARVYAGQGKLPKAIEEVNAVLEQKADTAEAHFLLGQLHERSGRFEEAIESFKKAVAVEPSHEEAVAALKAKGIEVEPPKPAAPEPPPAPAPVDAGATCLPLASGGIPIALDGVDDLGKYPASQILTPDPLTLNQPWELFGLAWDRDFLYVTQVSQGFEDEYEPLHVYLEASDALGTPTSTTGKEYSGLTPALPFAPTHVVAARVTDGVDAYNGVYTPDAQWSTKALALVSGVDVFVSADRHTLAARVPLEALGCPTHLRLAAHVVHDVVVANEWKDVVPTGHTPWAAPGGAYYEIDLTADPSVSSWTLRP